MHFISVDVFIYLFLVFIFNYKALFYLCKRLKMACLKIAIPDYCFNIFGSIFGVLFCLLIKILILGSKTIWQSSRNFPCAVESVRTFSHMYKKETFFFLKTAHWYSLNFLDDFLFIRLEKLKLSL